MFANPRNTLLFLGLAGGALATWIVARDNDLPPPQAAQLAPVQQGYYLLDAVIRETDQNGRFSHRLRAERVEQTDENGHLEFRGLRVEYLPEMDVRWDVYASAARSPADRSVFDLEDEVRFSYTSNNGQNEVVFKTSAFRIYTDGFRAETDRLVSIENMRTGSIMTTRGLELDFDTREMKLKSDVTIRGTR
jgi:LPS export ABC transporter protein LptC